MKKKIMFLSLSSTLLLGSFSPISSQYPIFAEEKTESHTDHDHDHDHDHEFEVHVEDIIKKEDDKYIAIHGDHYHKIDIEEFSKEEQEAIEAHLDAHPELAEKYDLEQNIYKGYFEDDMIKDRTLEDWYGDWQSVFPYLEDGTLDPVMDKKANAEGATMTAEEYKDYYTVGYKTDVSNIIIKDNRMTFVTPEGEATGTYEYAGYKILEYKKGNRGVRFLFSKVEGDESAPMSVQFSDHNIYPTKVSHYHIYFSNDSHDVLVEELENWPTFYPSEWSAGEILADQLNH